MYLWVWIEMFQRGWALAYSTSRGMTSSDRLHAGGILLGPLQIGLRFDDHLQFVGAAVSLVQRGLLPLGREADPVEHPAEGVRSGGFEEDLETLFAQLVGQHTQRIEQRFAARNDDGLRRTRRGTLDDRPHVGRRIELRVPRILGVAPAAADVAPAQTDEIGGFPGVEALALNRIEILDEGQQPPAVEQRGISRHSHYSVTT